MRGHGSLLVLRGDSGMGKTHILEEIKAIKEYVKSFGQDWDYGEAYNARNNSDRKDIFINQRTESEQKTPIANSGQPITQHDINISGRSTAN